MNKTIAIDFDGCLCEDAYPDIGKPNYSVIERMKIEQARGTRFILWTCREGAMLQKALDWCDLFGIEFDAVNENLNDWVIEYGSAPRKIGADEYWDDRAVRVGS